jgi:oxygen-independent coproporphyrinogen III oxidase
MTQVSSLYLHVPFCKHLCNYCDFYKRKLDHPHQQFEEFHQFLEGSWKRHQELMREMKVEWSPLETIYLGGGTPSLWGVEGAAFFEQTLLTELVLAPSCEFTMEVDPGTWTPELIESWRKLGVNRLSIGTQALTPEFLKILDRSHSLQETFDLLDYCQRNGWNFSLDFLLGVPHSDSKNRQILEELEQLLSYGASHVSLYILNARSKYPLIKHLPDDEYIREEYLTVAKFLGAKGFHHYEVSNFALPSFESRHNMKYWRSESVAALGPTGTGLFKLAAGALRYKWKVSTPEIEREDLKTAELELERTYLELRTSKGWRPDHLSQALLATFERWGHQGYGHWSGERMCLNSLGFLMLDSLVEDLFRVDAS